MPDERLRERAAAGVLRLPEGLLAEARRMLRDPRARALAVEFGANWLDIRDFAQLGTVDRERFPVFTDEVRSALFEEPVRFLQHIFQNNGSLLDLLYGRYTFVNRVLARYYGLALPAGTGAEAWVRVAAEGQGRGGLLPMAAFLTKNAPGLRTSPVKRGYWIARRILGEEIPPPPAVVPELPADEARMELPLREMLARHRSNAACASCHARFDSFGLALEGFDPVGRPRSADLAGRPVDAGAVFPGKVAGEGVAGLREYIRRHRERDFVRGFTGKLLAYALGRSLALSDEVLIDQIGAELARSGYRFETVVAGIVTSRQFLNKR